MTGERLAHTLGLDGPAAERDHRQVLALQELADHILLDGAEGGLALAVEEHLDRLPEPALDLPVAVHRLHAQLRGERAGAGRLPGAHEAHQDDRAVYRARLHPIRST